MSLPYVDGFLMELLRPLMPGYQVVTRLPAPELRKPPIIMARRIPGGGAVHPRFLDSALVQIDSFALTRRQAAAGIRSVSDIFYDAWFNQTVIPGVDGGHINGMEERSGPAEFPDSDPPAEMVRFYATYELFIRPKAA